MKQSIRGSAAALPEGRALAGILPQASRRCHQEDKLAVAPPLPRPWLNQATVETVATVSTGGVSPAPTTAGSLIVKTSPAL